jgi:hypothetical protein
MGKNEISVTKEVKILSGQRSQGVSIFIYFSRDAGRIFRMFKFSFPECQGQNQKKRYLN